VEVEVETTIWLPRKTGEAFFTISSVTAEAFSSIFQQPRQANETFLIAH